MESVNRRQVLRTSGVVGAVAAFSAATPRAWSWSPTGSIAGYGTGVDPATVWDEPADTLVASLLDRGGVPAVNEALKAWRLNADALPAGIPADVRDFVTSARRLPSWADPAKLRAAAEFNRRQGDVIAVLYGMGSGMMSCLIPHEAQAVYYSRGGANMKDRIAKTAKLGYDIGARNAYADTGSMAVTAVKTRMVHAAVRHLLPSSPYWQRTANQTVPISQLDLLVTWHSLASTVMQGLRRWKVPVTAAESAAYLHLWQVSAHLLGIRDEYIPATWDDAFTQRTAVLDAVLAPTSEGLKLAQILVNLGSAIDGGFASRPMFESMTRYVLGGTNADLLGLPRHPLQDAGIATGWPVFIRMRSAGLYVPGAVALYDTFDEFLRRGALFYLSSGKQIDIVIPDGNRTSF